MPPSMSGGCCAMSAMSSFCFVFSWAAGTAGGRRVVTAKGSDYMGKQSSAVGKFQ
jgi:hypothetical protein